MGEGMNTRQPTLEEAVEIIGLQITRSEQNRQLRYMAGRQGRDFAEKVHAKAKQAGKLRKK